MDFTAGRLALLSRIDEAGGFSAAARKLNIAKSALSHQIKLLEDEAGLKLFERAGRGVTLTNAGRILAGHGQRIRREAEEATAAIREMEQPRGTLRVSMPSGIADALLIPMLSAFLREHPAISVAALANDAISDLVEERVDLAFRIGQIDDGEFAARRLCDAEEIFAASAGYLRRAGAPDDHTGLAGHQFVGFAAFGEWQTYQLERADGWRGEATVRCRVTTTSSATLKNWALAGEGIVRIFSFAIEAEIARGELVRVLPAYKGRSVPLHAVHMPGRRLPGNARRLIGFALDYFRPPAGETAGKNR